MQYVSEGKKIKESDIPIIAKFIIEVIRRYPSTVEMLETAFQESLKVIGTTKLAIAQTIKKNLFLLYCELCLCGIVGKEAMVGKMLKAMVEAVSSSEVFVYDLIHSRLPFLFIMILFNPSLNCIPMNMLVLFLHFSLVRMVKV